MEPSVAKTLAGLLKARENEILAPLLAERDPGTREKLRIMAQSLIQEQVALLGCGPATDDETVAALGRMTRNLETAVLFNERISFLRESQFEALRGLGHGAGDDLAFYRTNNDVFSRAFYLLHQRVARFEEQEMASRDRRERLLVEAIGGPFALLDAAGVVVLANPRMTQLIGAGDLAGRDFTGFCDEATGETLRRVFRRRRNLLCAERFEGRIRTVGEEPEWVFCAQPTFDARGLREGTSLLLEKTESGRMEEADVLAYLKHRFADIVPIPVQLFEAGGRVLHANGMHGAVEVPGLRGDVPYCCHFHRALGRAGTCACRQVFALGQPWSEEMMVGTAGAVRWFRVVIMPLYAPGGQVRWAGCGLMETTSRRLVERQLENRLLAQQRSSVASQVVLSVAHQIRTPLSVITGFAEMLSRGVAGEQAREMVAGILRNGIRCREIVDDLTGFGQALPMDRIPADLCALLHACVLPMLTATQAARVEWRLPEDAPWVECAPEQLARVILSLFDNALLFGGGRVVCGVRRDGGRVLLEVCDDGPGIPPELAEQVFEPFFTTRRSQGGVGLGLSLARSVVRELGGDLVADCGGDGPLPGARLVLSLPALARAGTPPARKTEEKDRDRSGKGEAPPPPRVLVVDDEEDLQNMLGRALTLHGNSVTGVGTAEAALERLAAGEPFDALVLDIQLPGAIGGQRLLELVEESRPDLARRAIVITADTLNYETHRFLQGLKCPYHEKPFMISDLLKSLELVLGRRGDVP